MHTQDKIRNCVENSKTTDQKLYFHISCDQCFLTLMHIYTDVSLYAQIIITAQHLQEYLHTFVH